MNEHLTDIVNRLASQIIERQGRDRTRNNLAQAHFLHGIEHLVLTHSAMGEMALAERLE